MRNIKIKLKTGIFFVLTINSFNTQALERFYSFNADFISSNWNLTLTRDGAEPFIDLRPFISNQDPAANFVMANSSISGKFAYNTNAPITHSTVIGTVNDTFYNSQSSPFSVTLNNGSGINQQISSNNSNSFRETRIYSFSHPISGRQSFSTRGFGITPGINLTSTVTNCFGQMFCSANGSYFIKVSATDTNNNFFTESLTSRFPTIFSGINSFDLEINSVPQGQIIAPEFNLKANSMYLGLSYKGTKELPTDGSLPNTLPKLATTNYNTFTLGFSSNANYEPVNLHVSNIDFTYGPAGDLVTNNPGAAQDKRQQIEDFLAGANITSDIGIDYSLNSLSLIADGLTPNTPLLPTVTSSPQSGFEFTFETSTSGDFTFIDPDIAIGYDYEITSGSTFTSVLLPENIGDNLYDLWLFDQALGDFIDSGINLTGGVAYTFGQEGLSLFRILGIETDALLDPNDPFSFVTGLKFSDPGATVNISQTAISQFIPSAVPVPPSFILFASGVIGLFIRRRNFG